MNREKIKIFYKNIMLIIVVILITFVMTSAFFLKKTRKSSKYTLNSNISDINLGMLQKIKTLKNIIDRDYISDVNEKNLIDSAIKGYVEGLGDEYTQYFTKEEMEDFKTDTEGEYVGIGIYMYKNTVDNTIVVLYPIKNSPAEEVGLKYGDIIKKVDGVKCVGEDFETISTKIKGKEGTKVKLEIERNGEILTFDIERKSIDLYPIEYEMLDNDIGYIKLLSFDEKCAKEFKNIYNEFKKNKNINGLILDLRNNGGGVLDEALKIADYMLEKDDTILITKDKVGNEEVEKSKNEPIVDVPIIVLVNQNSASASEIIAAALKENKKAIIVGEKTYGKGVIQGLITLPDGSGIKLTIEEYYTPNKNKINKLGIEPDEKVSLLDKENDLYEIEKKYDTQLQKAIEILKK